ncbi:MAG TPA: hypothetical protein VKZ53_06500 [Candidatus Angelobacter sp.]|nr:hypothetical protein [Candidatus Angelobacter sp.]
MLKTVMAQFPQPHSRTRAPRVKVPSNESVHFKLGGRQVAAKLHRLSLTGGLAEFPQPVGDIALAEVVLETTSGPVNALVELLPPSAKQQPSARPFRFVALDDEDYQRLVSTLQVMRRQGFTE